MFSQAGVETGVDLDELVNTATWIRNKLSLQPQNTTHTPVSQEEKNKAQLGLGSKTQEWTLERETSGLLIHRSGINLRVSLNNAKNGNALTVEMMDDLVSAFEKLENDGTVRRVAIIGAGRFFCTGMDLRRNIASVDSSGASSSDQLTG